MKGAQDSTKPEVYDLGRAWKGARAGRISSQAWSEAYVFFRQEDDGTAPRLALRLMWIAGAGGGRGGARL